MVLPTQYYHDGTGSPLNSGSNAPTTAHRDTTLSQTVSGTAGTKVLTFGGTINLTGVLDDGSDTIVVTGNSGERHIFQILTFTGSVSSCTGLGTAEDVGGTNITASAWGIGGKRLDHDNDTSNDDFVDFGPGWHMELNDGGQFNSSIEFLTFNPGTKATGPTVIRTESGFSTRAEFNSSASHCFRTSTPKLPVDTFFEFHDVKLTSIPLVTAQHAVFRIDGTYVHALFKNVEFNANGTSSGDGFFLDAHNSSVRFLGCLFIAGGSNTGAGIALGIGQAARIDIIRCRFTDLGGVGIEVDHGSAPTKLNVVDCIFDGCTIGIEVTRTTDDASHYISHCAFYNQSSDGIKFTSATSPNNMGAQIEDCIFEDSGGYGVNVVSEHPFVFVENCAFFSNTSGQTNNIVARQKSGTIALSVSSFTDPANADFSLNSAATGGALVDDEATEIAN